MAHRLPGRKHRDPFDRAASLGRGSRRRAQRDAVADLPRGCLFRTTVSGHQWRDSQPPAEADRTRVTMTATPLASAPPIERPYLHQRPAPLGWLVLGASLLTALASFVFVAGLTPIEPTGDRVNAVLVANGVMVLLFIAVVVFEGRRMIRARRRRRAGSQLHLRIVALVSVAAAVPAIVLATSATLTLDRALAPWFFGPIRSFVEGSTEFARAFVTLQCQSLRRDTRVMAVDISRGLTRILPDREVFRSFVASRAESQGVSYLLILDDQNRIFESAASNAGPTPPLPTLDDFRQIAMTQCLPTQQGQPLRVLMPLETPAGARPLFLFAVRPLDPRTASVFMNSQAAVAEYQRNEDQRVAIQFAFGMMYLLLTVNVLLAAIFIGLNFANRLVAPVGRLIHATDEVAVGNFYVQVPVRKSDGDLAHLGETFNKMTSELKRQRDALVAANGQIDQRRRFTEAVLSGVPAGVVGLERDGTVSVVNPMAERMLGARAPALTGRKIGEVAPQLQKLFAEARAGRMRLAQGQLAWVEGGRELVVNARVTRERGADGGGGYVVTLDDISDLVTAQRSSAWADVARRIAHEIKNPLTPIQLSIERIKRKYGKAIVTDREVFDQCTDTIVRQVEDIKRMVDEFSSFARMPKPALQDEDIVETLKQVSFLATMGYPDVRFDVGLPEGPLMLRFDRRLVSQAVTNILKNATEGVAAVPESERGQGVVALDFRIEKRIEDGGEAEIAVIEITDNGKGFPSENRRRLLEPYVTTREGGTGLGLPIVGKIFEDHGGGIDLLDNPAVARGGRGARVRLWFPVRDAGRRDKPADPAARGDIQIRDFSA
jgi:two-component system nitrogen regulation sensor histidine kinase NtrY